MNWDAIGAVGEIVGAAGVILSLVYLAAQIRHNTKQVDEAGRSHRLETLSPVLENDVYDFFVEVVCQLNRLRFFEFM